MSERPKWWPTAQYEHGNIPSPDRCIELGVKAVLERIRELGDGHLGVWVDEDCILSSDEWWQLRKEVAGL